MKRSDEEVLSKTIDFLRFPLIVGVVYLHVFFENPTILGELAYSMAPGNICYYICQLVSQVFGRLSVPLFFFISGFLFFYRTELLWQDYFKKIKNRVYSLFIPYVCWHLFWFILSTLLNKHFNINHFWFIRDLMIIALFSPLVKLLVTKLRWMILVLAFIVWFFNLFDYGTTTFFFFTLGAYFSINKLNVVTLCRKFFTFTIISYSLLALTDLFTKEYLWNVYVHSLGIFAGIFFVINITSFYIERGKVSSVKFLASSTFFVYSAHEPLSYFFRKFIVSIFQPTMQWQVLGLYFIIPVLLISFLLAIYYLLNKYFPRLKMLFVGR